MKSKLDTQLLRSFQKLTKDKKGEKKAYRRLMGKKLSKEEGGQGGQHSPSPTDGSGTPSSSSGGGNSEGNLGSLLTIAEFYHLSFCVNLFS
jgi:hypothetical protein